MLVLSFMSFIVKCLFQEEMFAYESDKCIVPIILNWLVLCIKVLPSTVYVALTIPINSMFGVLHVLGSDIDT